MNSSLFLILFLSAAAITSCRKEPVTNHVNAESSVNGRAPNGEIVGVSLFDGVNPSQIVTMDDATGNVQFNVPAAYNGTYPLDNLKGICYYATNSYFLTADLPSSAPVVNSFFRVNNTNGVANFVTAIPGTVGVISDIEYDEIDNIMYGLQDNSNNLVVVTGFLGAPNYTVLAINGLPNGYTAQGLALVGQHVYIAASSAAGDTKLYAVDTATGAAGFISDMTPTADLAGGHCGLGYDADFKHLLINRFNNPSGTPVAGVNDASWPFTGNPTVTAFWGGSDWDFEDLVCFD